MPKAVAPLRFYKSTFFTLCLVFVFCEAYCNEIYYIDNNPLFLYKTINWWYDCLPEESKKLCKRPIKCSNTGNAETLYDEASKNIELKIKGGFATMLLAFKKCKQCYGPSRFHCIWFDQNYYNDTAANVIVNDSSKISGITFSNIEKEQAQHIQSIAHDLQFILEGVIGGLSNGQIALHASGNLLKRCNGASQDPDERYPITLKIKNTSTDEIIAIFGMSWES
jgi:hypothetical protein